MENIINDETIKECSKVLGNQVQNTPQLDTSKIILTADVNPKNLRRINLLSNTAVKTTTGTLNFLLTPADRDFYLTNINVSVIKDATCDTATGALNCNAFFNGQAINIVPITIITLTAQTINFAINFPTPLKIDRNSQMALGGTFTVGAMVRQVTCQGYTVENQTAL